MAARVLVFDDTEELLETFRILLEGEGYDAFLYSFAPQELPEVKRIKPDIIILDLIFGGEKLGWQLLEKLKLDRETMHIPVVLCTAATLSVREIEGYLAAQNVALVPKPFDLDQLLSALKNALANTQRTANTADEGDKPDDKGDDAPGKGNDAAQHSGQRRSQQKRRSQD